MNKLLSAILSALILSGCASRNRSSLPYEAWHLSFFAPDYMEVWIETADTYGINGMVRVKAGSGIPAIGYPRAFSKGIPEVFRGDPKGWDESPSWGKGKYVKGADLPKQIYVRWQSLVEPQTYHTRIDIPESTREIMRKKETAFCLFTGKTEARYLMTRGDWAFLSRTTWRSGSRLLTPSALTAWAASAQSAVTPP